MGQTVFVLGAPRCGKTILTRRIIEVAKGNCSIVSLDALSFVLRHGFEDFELYSKRLIIQPDVNIDKFSKIVKVYIEAFFEDFPDETIIVEGCQFMPKQIKELFPKSKIICLGITGNIEDIKDAIITKEWMSKLPQADIDEYAEKIYQLSTCYKKECNDIDYLYCEAEQANINDIVEYLNL